jgi:predicted metalloprotease with PDZ domain
MVFVFPDPQTDGGAFSSSFALRIASPVRPVESIVWSHLLGHELMHLWNGAGRIRTAEDGSAYWFTEGVTDYLTIKLMYEAGLLDRDMLAQRLANLVRRVLIAERLTPRSGFAAAGGRKAEQWHRLYGGGALFALLLDAELSATDSTAFRSALRDAYAGGVTPYDHEGLLRRLNRTTNGRASEIVQWLEGAPDDAQIRERLARSGIAIATFVDEVYVTYAPCGTTACVPAFLAARAASARTPVRARRCSAAMAAMAPPCARRACLTQL